MPSLPADRTKLALAQSNQVPATTASSSRNINSITEAYDTIDMLYNYINGFVTSGTLSPIPSSLKVANGIINGNFDVPQRGTIFTNPSSGAYTLDRFFVAWGPGTSGALPTTMYVSQQSIIGDELYQSKKYCSISWDGAGTPSTVDGFYTYRQKIENGTHVYGGSAKKVTISFQARSTIADKKIAINLKQNYGSGGSPSAEEELTGATFNLTVSWQKFSVEIDMNSLAGKTFGSNNDDYLAVVFWVMWGSNFISRFDAGSSETFKGAGQVDITQVQICADDVALPFQPRTFAEELTSCQRYYEKSYNTEVTPATATTEGIAFLQPASNATLTGGRIRLTVPFKVTKRLSPATLNYWDAGGNATKVTTITDDTQTNNVTQSSLVSGIGKNSFYITSTNGPIAFQWICDAEL